MKFIHEFDTWILIFPLSIVVVVMLRLIFPFACLMMVVEYKKKIKMYIFNVAIINVKMIIIHWKELKKKWKWKWKCQMKCVFQQLIIIYLFDFFFVHNSVCQASNIEWWWKSLSGKKEKKLWWFVYTYTYTHYHHITFMTFVHKNILACFVDRKRRRRRREKSIKFMKMSSSNESDDFCFLVVCCSNRTPKSLIVIYPFNMIKLTVTKRKKRTRIFFLFISGEFSKIFCVEFFFLFSSI